MSIKMQIALIGILGTLGGTILGWLLNSLSQKGKLYMATFISNKTNIRNFESKYSEDIPAMYGGYKGGERFCKKEKFQRKTGNFLERRFQTGRKPLWTESIRNT